MAGASQEYVVRAPNENSKRFNVMRFANSLNVDVTKWKVARMERERSLKQQDKAATEEAPKFGFGSEYGKDAKEEARRKKYGQYYRKNRDNDFPWVLRVGGKNGKKFKGTREGGVTENTSYYVFFQAHDGAFEAFPVSEWYNFSAIPRYKPLTSEEAEERYEERHKIYNHFAVMASRKHTEGGEGEQSETKLLKNMKKEKDFKVSDMDDWVDSDRSGDGSDDDELDGGNQKNGKGKGKGKAKGAGKKKGGKKKKGSDDDDDDSEPGEESDEGDQEAREVDYMSDLSSSSEEEDLEEKLNKELKGVEDEDALRKLVLSDDDDDEEEEGKDKEDAKGTAKGDGDEVSKSNEPAGKVKVKQENKSSDSGTSASDDSDDSDLDDSKFQSAMFLQKKSGSASKNKNGSDQKASSSKSNTPVTDQAGQSNNDNGDNDSKSALKRKLPSAENSPSVKKPKTNDSGSGGEAISEDAVRRYLMRKPMTAAELLQKFKGRKVPLKGQDLVTTIAAILKKLNPDKQTIKGKLHLYIKPPTGP